MPSLKNAFSHKSIVRADTKWQNIRIYMTNRLERTQATRDS